MEDRLNISVQPSHVVAAEFAETIAHALERPRARFAGRTLGTSNDRSSARESPAMAIDSD
jgi:hypothetical protein